MGYIGKFTRGPYTLQVDGSARLTLGLDFTPPGLQQSTTVAVGTSANRTGGATLVGQRAINQSWAFSIRCLGATNAECERAADDLIRFLNQAGDPAEPLHFHFKPDNDLTFEPTWGQLGANRRVEIVAIENCRKWPAYTAGNLRTRGFFVQLTFQIRPYALGKQNRLASATGGVVVDNLGMTDGTARGLYIAPALTNYHKNNIFSHATWNTGWTADGGLTATQNRRTEFTLFGPYSAKLANTTTGFLKYVESVTAANTNTHVLSAYVRRPDGAAVTTSDLLLHYNVQLSSAIITVEALGDGHYRAWATVAGIAGATNSGVEVAGRTTIYLEGMQLEENTRPTPLANGSQLGCAWAGTAHASNTTRAAGRLRVDITDVFDAAQGTIYLVWKPDVPATWASGMTLWSNSATGLRMTYNAATDRFLFTDQTNTVQSATQTFVAGDILHLACTWSGYVGATGEIKLYVAGALADTDVYAPTAPGADVYVGTTTAAASHARGTFLGFTIFDRVLSAAEILALYTNVVQLTNDGQRVDWLPALWTDDGDQIVDNCLDSTRENYAVVLDIPGDSAAETVIFGQTSSNFSVIGGLWLSSLAEKRFYKLPTQIFFDQSGTVVASTCGGEVKGTTVTTSDTPIVTTEYVYRPEGGFELLGKSFTLLARIAHASGSATVSLQPYYDITNVVTADYKPVAMTTTYFLYATNKLALPTKDRVFSGELVTDAFITFSLRAKVASGTEAIRVDYCAVLFDPFIHIEKSSTTVAPGFVYSSARHTVSGLAAGTAPAIGAVTDLNLPLTGQRLELRPAYYNLLTSYMGAADAAPVITYTLTYTIFITPRWSLT